MKRGNLLFFRSPTILSWTIRKVLDFEFSHVALVTNTIEIIESDWGGVVKSQISKYNDSFFEEFDIGLAPEQREILIAHLEGQIGCKYDFTLLFGGVISRAIHRPRTGKSLWNNIYRNTCSELISEGLQRLGKAIPFDPSQMTPKDLYSLRK